MSRWTGTPRPAAGGVPASYRAVLSVHGFPRVLGAAALADVAQQMQSVVLVLFVLERYGSPQLAGLTVLLQVAPGLVVSPVAGALLDRGRRVRLMMLDYSLAAAAMAIVGVLAFAGLLPPGALLGIVTLASLTGPLSRSGVRSLLPLMVPRDLWDRANAVDSGRYVVSTVVGPALGGSVVAAAGGSAAVLATALVSAGAAAILVGGPEPGAGVPAGGAGILRDSVAGLLYVWRNRTLRGLAVSVSVFNVGYGILTIALPVLVLDRLHRGAALVGGLWAVSGVAGMVSGALFGRVGSVGRERVLMSLGAAGSVGALALLAGLPTLGAALVAMCLMGASNGPFDIGMFAIRQRRTDHAWVGRAFAVSMSLNFAGFPVGSVLAGAVVGRSLTVGLLVAALFAAAAVALPFVAVPAADASRDGSR